MKTNISGKKSIVIVIVLLLFLGLNLTIPSSFAAPNQTSDGTWYDNFDNLTGVSEIDFCVLSNGIIKLEKGVHDYDYNFADGKGHEAWDVKLSSIFSDDSDLIRMRNLFGQSSVNIEGLKEDDGKVVRTESQYIELLNITFSPAHHFRFEVGRFGKYFGHFGFSWHGNYSSDANVDSVQLYAWNYSALFGVGMWENLGNVSYDASIGTNTDGDINVISFYSGYISDDGYMDFLIVALPDEQGKPSILDTDYVNVTVTTTDCYAREGYIVSTNISPPSLGRWESLIWSGSPLSDSASLKIHVLNGYGHLIDDYDLPGNSEGFTISPIDLSNLPKNTIKLNASFQSIDLSFTPWLKSWGVTWQTQDSRFHDDFNTDLRIDKAFGVKFSGSKISINTNYSDWPIYGKNPENTRSYEGYGPSNTSAYRYTEGTAVGGGLRSPILSDGKIYIASSVDQKIHVFDADDLSPLAPQSSELPYVVDASVAVADNLVIVATSEMNQSNRIYALNKSTLSKKEWSYVYGDGTEDICFSSAPTISDEKVFVTSWNGMGWDMPLLSILYELQLLKGNNKIIALNLNDGAEIWNASLPSGSFSTPAVADGMVFVGCDNIMGNSLFAFDEETGVKIWNTSVGLIGRSSPVIYDHKVFVVVKDQSLISLTGDVKVIAVDEYNGSVLWDTTIATSIPAFESLPKSLQLYNIMATSTPAIYEATLFATSPDGKLSALKTMDGEKLWSVNLSSGLFVLLPLYPCTSPVATANGVYATSANGYVHAVSMSGEKLWDFRCVTNQSNFLDMNYILAAPIVADGVLYVSVTEELAGLSGRVFSIGNTTTKQRGKVISNPIHVPKEKWWSTFTADVEGNGDVTFSILDEHYNVLSYDVGEISNSSIINTNVIRLCAKFSKNGSENPRLDSWSIIWKANAKPVLDKDSFIPNPEGWINNNTPVCSINVRDAMPGLNVDSARYRITYISDENESVTSNWSTANCSGEYGTTENQTIVADISAFNLSEDIAELKSITISIQDLAAYESKIKIEFKTDTIKPTSNIVDANNFSSKYNESVVITANASDPGDPKVNKSDIESVTLYYRFQGDEEWISYSTDVESPYNWSFENDTSGNYEFCTIAKDHAGNIEDTPSQGNLSFIFDMNKPNSPAYGDRSLYRFNEIPEFSDERLISFSDDFKLKSIEYRLSFHGIYDWTPVDLDINSKNYKEEWNLTISDWDDMKEGEDYTLYFKLTDSCGNQYITPDNEALTIVKDLTVSKPYLDLSDFEEWQWDNTFTISADIPDDSDVKNVTLFYRYAADSKQLSEIEWKQYGDSLTTSPFEWEFTATEGSGYYEFKTRISDIAGNVGESPIESIGVTLFPLIQMILVVSLAIILTLVTAYILGKMKKKKR